MKNRQTNLSEIRQQRQMFQDQIKQMRVKINSHLDTLSDAYSLTALMSLCNPSTVFEFLESCFNRLSIFDLILSSVSSSFCRILEDGYLQQLNLRYKINTKIQDILSTITTFGSVSIETSPPSVVR
jgi:hypothetical protein